MNDLALPVLLILSWVLFVSALLRPGRGPSSSRQGVVLLAVGAGAAGLVLWGETRFLVVLLLACAGAGFGVWRRRRRVAPSLVELALLAEYLSHQLLGGGNLGGALRQAGREATREPPTLPLPLLGPSLSRQAQMLATGADEEQALLELGAQFEDPTVRSFFAFLAALAQNVTQEGLADALEGMAERVGAYRELETSFQSRLAMARTTRYVMLLLVPGLLYVIAFHSPLMEGGPLNSPLGLPLILFDLAMLGLALLVGSWLSRLPGLEF
jgi:hypothetical protein